MLPARNRLRSSGDFAVTVRRGVRAGQRTLVMHALAAEPAADDSSCVEHRVEQPRVEQHKDSPPVQVGFVVSKAVGNAVRRNQTKRRLRALMVDHLDALPPGARVVVRALPAAASAGSAELASDLERAVRRTAVKLSMKDELS